jgi:hypothetical protein
VKPSKKLRKWVDTTYDYTQIADWHWFAIDLSVWDWPPPRTLTPLQKKLLDYRNGLRSCFSHLPPGHPMLLNGRMLRAVNDWEHPRIKEYLIWKCIEAGLIVQLRAQNKSLPERSIEWGRRFTVRKSRGKLPKISKEETGHWQDFKTRMLKSQEVDRVARS